VVPNTSPSQIISHFDFSTYINFTIHNAPKHDIYSKNCAYRKVKTANNLDRGSNSKVNGVFMARILWRIYKKKKENCKQNQSHRMHDISYDDTCQVPLVV